jgi:hypothetical protein
MGRFNDGGIAASREAWKLSPRAVERYKQSAGTLGQENTLARPFLALGQENTLARPFLALGQENTLARPFLALGQENTSVVEHPAIDEAAESREPSEGEAATALHEILVTIFEHALEAAVHVHGFGLLLKVMDFVVELCQMAAVEEGRRQTNDEEPDT